MAEIASCSYEARQVTYYLLTPYFFTTHFSLIMNLYGAEALKISDVLCCAEALKISDGLFNIVVSIERTEKLCSRV